MLANERLYQTRDGGPGRIGSGGARRNAAAGAEHWFGQWLGVRGGARVNLEAAEPQLVGAVGLSVALTSGVYLDGQLTRGREASERGWGVAARVGF